MAEGTNLYACLGIPKNATPDDIRRAYRAAALRLHPDTNTKPGATELFLKVQEAYSVLSDPAQRQNYDRTLPDEEIFKPEVAISTLYSRAKLQRHSEPQLIYALLELNAYPENSATLTPPINICLILDRSTSMQGPYLDTVKATAIEIVRQLRAQDIFSLVSFSDRAEVIVSPQLGLERNQVETRIRMLHSHGGTEILQGLEAGMAEVRRYRRSDYVNHIILITDGRTYGDEEKCLRLAKQAANEAIGISALGIGSKWNDQFLDELTSLTGSNSQLVSQPSDIHHLLKDKFSHLGHSYADRVVYYYTSNPDVSIRNIFRLQPDVSPLDCTSPVQLGSIPNNSSLSFLVEFLIQSVPADAAYFTLAEGHISLDIPTRSIPTYTLRLDLQCPTGNDPDVEPVPQTIMQAVSKMTLYSMQERVNIDVANGNISAATRRLQFLATHLMSNGEKELARTVLHEVGRLEAGEHISEDGKKRIKYGTRSLFLSPQEMNSSEKKYSDLD